MSNMSADFTPIIDNAIDKNQTIVSIKAELSELKADVALLKDLYFRHDKKLDTHDRKLDEHGKKLDEHGKKLDEHGKKLDEHGKKLDYLLISHDEMKHNISLILDSVSFLVDEHKKMKRLTTQLEDIKDEHPQLKQIVKQHINDKKIHLRPKS